MVDVIDASRSLRVLHLAFSVGWKSGGVGPATLGLVRGQRELGVDSEIWCMDIDDGSLEAAASYALQDAIRIWPISPPAVLGFSLKLHRELMSLSKPMFDIIHHHGIWLAYAHTTASFAKKFGRPTIVAPEGSLYPYALKMSEQKKRLAFCLYERRNLERAKCMYALSEAEAETFRMYGLGNEIATVGNGVSMDWLESTGDGLAFRRQFDLDQGKPIILFLGRLHPQKGLDLLIQATFDMKDSAIEHLVVIAGDGKSKYVKSLRDLVRELGLQKTVRFVGPLYGGNKRNAFAAASVFVLPSWGDALSIAVLESLAAGVPVIATKGCPWRELVTFGCGWWIEGNRQALLDSLNEALRMNPEDLRCMGSNGKELIRGKYTWPLIAQQSAVLYRYLVNGSVKPGFVAK